MNLRAQAAPLYQGIFEEIRQRIADGRLAPGDQTPTQGDLCRDFGVSPITAKRALAELQKAGLVYSLKGRGTFVARRWAPPPSSQARRAAIKAIGLVTSSLDAVKARSFFAEIWQSVEQAARQNDLAFRVQILPDTTPDQHLQLQFKPDPSEGLVFVASSHPYRVLPMVVEQSVPTVVIDSALPFSNCVLTDNLEGMRQIVDHLASRGHRRIALAARHPRSPNPTNENERIAAFAFLMADRKLEGCMLAGDRPADIAHEAMGRHRITAVIFTQDDPALEFLGWATAHDLRVPQQLSVVGFDGWSHSKSDIELTTLAVDREGLGRAAVDLLRRPEVPDSLHSQWHRVPGRLIAGRTVTAAYRR